MKLLGLLLLAATNSFAQTGIVAIPQADSELLRLCREQAHRQEMTTCDAANYRNNGMPACCFDSCALFKSFTMDADEFQEAVLRSMRPQADACILNQKTVCEAQGGLFTAGESLVYGSTVQVPRRAWQVGADGSFYEYVEHDHGSYFQAIGEFRCEIDGVPPPPPVDYIVPEEPGSEPESGEGWDYPIMEGSLVPAVVASTSYVDPMYEQMMYQAAQQQAQPTSYVDPTYEQMMYQAAQQQAQPNSYVDPMYEQMMYQAAQQQAQPTSYVDPSYQYYMSTGWYPSWP